MRRRANRLLTIARHRAGHERQRGIVGTRGAVGGVHGQPRPARNCADAHRCRAILELSRRWQVPDGPGAGARELEISPRTVEIHRMKMMGKLGARHAAEAVRLRIEATGLDEIAA